MRIEAIFLGLTLVIATPAAADNHTFDGCDLTPDEYNEILLPVLHGTWQVFPGPGTMLVSDGAVQTALPVKPEAPEPGTFEYIGDDRLVIGDITQYYEVTIAASETLGDYGLSDPKEPDFQRVMDLDALGEDVPNCSPDVLPIITYSGDVGTADSPAQFEAYLHVISADLMSGILITNVTAPDQGQIHIRRFITFQR